MAKNTVHKGAPRRYWCPHYLDENGRVQLESPNRQDSRGFIPGTPVGGCVTLVLTDGTDIPLCVQHGLRLKKARFKRAEERQMEAYHRSKLQIGETFYWSDDAVRKARCHLCQGQIERGERRIAIDSKPRYRAGLTSQGGVITRQRAYVHASCFIDMVYGGTAGEGCPGCSAKILHDEFMEVKGLLEKEYGDG